jgi:hypothetical protein
VNVFAVTPHMCDNTHGLQLATGDVYEAEVHVFIYGDTWFE